MFPSDFELTPCCHSDFLKPYLFTIVFSRAMEKGDRITITIIIQMIWLSKYILENERIKMQLVKTNQISLAKGHVN